MSIELFDDSFTVNKVESLLFQKLLKLITYQLLERVKYSPGECTCLSSRNNEEIEQDKLMKL